MAADSLVTDDEEVFEARLSPKVFEWEGFLFGVCGDARVCDLVYAVFDPPDPSTEHLSDYHYMVADFIPALRKMLKEGGVKLEKSGSEDEEDLGLEMLVGFKGLLYLIGSDFSVCTFASPYYAIGGGSSFALASLVATSVPGQIKEPLKRVEKAVAAACKRRADCGGKIIVESI